MGIKEHQERYRESKGYAAWKSEAQRLLERLVASNYLRLYDASPSEEHDIWVGISKQVHGTFVPQGLDPDDHSDETEAIRLQRRNYVAMMMEEYTMEIFPHELSDGRTYRFVKQYGKLPTQLPGEWREFEREELEQQRLERLQRRERVRAAIAAFREHHPEYAHR